MAASYRYTYLNNNQESPNSEKGILIRLFHTLNPFYHGSTAHQEQQEEQRQQQKHNTYSGHNPIDEELCIKQDICIPKFVHRILYRNIPLSVTTAGTDSNTGVDSDIEAANKRLVNEIGLKHAISSSYLSIIFAVIAFFLSIRNGTMESSMSLFGVAIISLVDFTGSILVLYRYKYLQNRLSSHKYSPKQLQRIEIFFSGVIGSLMSLLGFVLILTSLIKLYSFSHPSRVRDGIFTGILGFLSGYFLYVYKRHVALALDNSTVIYADAKCSLGVGLVSLAVTIALIMTNISDLLWFLDGLLGAFVGIYVLRDSFLSVRMAFREMKHGGVHNGSSEDSTKNGNNKSTAEIGMPPNYGANSNIKSTMKTTMGDMEECKDPSIMYFQNTEEDDEETLTFSL